MAALVRKLSQIGNSKGIILPQTVLEMLNWDSDAEVELRIEGKKLIVSACRRRYATDEEGKAVADKGFAKHLRLMEKLPKQHGRRLSFSKKLCRTFRHRHL